MIANRVTVKRIPSITWEFCNLFDDNNVNSFSKWCTHQKLDFLYVKAKRTNSADDLQKIRTRSLFVLKNEYLDDAAKKISQYLPLYQRHVSMLKDDGFTIFGYVSKSPGSESKETRCNLLRAMSNKLRERSLVDVVFASPCCRASDPIEKRDLKKNEGLEGLDVAGNNQDFLFFINGKEKVCLVTLDYAGLSTDCADLEQFLRKYAQIKKKHG